MTLGYNAMSNSGLQGIAQGYVNSLGLWALGSMTDRLEGECKCNLHVKPFMGDQMMKA